MVVLFALLSAISYGSADFLGGFSSRKNSTSATVAWAQAMGLVTVLIAAPLVGAERVIPQDLLWGILAGISGACGVMMLFRGLSRGMASIVSPMAALTGAVLPVVYGFALGERPALLTWMGVALAIPAILLLTWEKSEKRDHVFQALQLGVLSGAFFGGFFILISRSSDSSGMWPLAAARITTVPLFLLLTLFRKKKILLEPGTRRATLASGFLDMAANVFYLLAARTGFLIIAVILTALYPAPTVLFHRIFLKEKLNLQRVMGLILSIAGAALIGVGG